MSVVACRVTKDKISIASDSITVGGWNQEKDGRTSFSKLFQVNNIIIGGVGTLEEISLLKIFCTTHQPEASTESAILTFLAEFSDWKKERTDSYNLVNQYILIFKQKAWRVRRFHVAEILTYEATGAGENFALAALYLEHSPKKAVHTACQLSPYCEEPIIQMEVLKT